MWRLDGAICKKAHHLGKHFLAGLITGQVLQPLQKSKGVQVKRSCMQNAHICKRSCMQTLIHANSSQQHTEMLLIVKATWEANAARYLKLNDKIFGKDLAHKKNCLESSGFPVEKIAAWCQELLACVSQKP